MQITNYNYKNYKGGIQNWGITVSPGQILYSSNNNGLLRYNGNDWTLLEPGERSTVRTVRCIGDRIYTAGDNNIGYWQYDVNGKINYTSLLPLVNKLGIKGETFWSIAETEGKVYFHSFGNIIWYDSKDMGYLPAGLPYDIFIIGNPKHEFSFSIHEDCILAEVFQLITANLHESTTALLRK